MKPNLRIFPEPPRDGDSLEHPDLFVALEPMTAAIPDASRPLAARGDDTRQIRLTEHGRVVDAFLAAAWRAADHPAVVTRTACYHYADIVRGCNCVARFLLQGAGFRSGDRVALMLDNGPEYVAAYYGILAAGGVVVPLPPNVEAIRLERIAIACGVRTILTSNRIVSQRTGGRANARATIPLDDCTARGAPRGAPLCIDGQTLAMIMFTSGSSGEPKGVMLSDCNILANAQSILGYLPIDRHDRALALLPFYHAFGHSIMQTHLLAGATLIIDGAWAFPNSVVDALQRHSVSSFSAVPEGYHALLLYSDLGHRRLPHLKYMSVAGGALRPQSVTEVANRIAPADFHVMYGQTEATARLASLPPEQVQVRPDSIGRAIPGVELRVLDEHGQEVAVGGTGQLCARGPNIMLGYWNDRCATEAAIRDGWLRTGDLATRDHEGLFYVQARTSDLVKLQGFRVHPREVEDVVSRYFPDLRVIVVPYCHHGTTRLALFAISGTHDASLVEWIRRVCLRELPRHKIPCHVQLLPQAPLNASLKLDRAALARLAEADAQALEWRAAITFPSPNGAAPCQPRAERSAALGTWPPSCSEAPTGRP